MGTGTQSTAEGLTIDVAHVPQSQALATQRRPQFEQARASPGTNTRRSLIHVQDPGESVEADEKVIGRTVAIEGVTGTREPHRAPIPARPTDQIL